MKRAGADQLLRLFELSGISGENGQGASNKLCRGDLHAISVWLMLTGMLYSLQLNTGSFPKPLTAEVERHYLELASQGDMEARNILVERNLRLVAHIMNKG